MKVGVLGRLVVGLLLINLLVGAYLSRTGVNPSWGDTAAWAQAIFAFFGILAVGGVAIWQADHARKEAQFARLNAILGLAKSAVRPIQVFNSGLNHASSMTKETSDELSRHRERWAAWTQFRYDALIKNLESSDLAGTGDPDVIEAAMTIQTRLQWLRNSVAASYTTNSVPKEDLRLLAVAAADVEIALSILERSHAEARKNLSKAI